MRHVLVSPQGLGFMPQEQCQKCRLFSACFGAGWCGIGCQRTAVACLQAFADRRDAAAAQAAYQHEAPEAPAAQVGQMCLVVWNCCLEASRDVV